jgi:DnaK suppressor protein
MGQGSANAAARTGIGARTRRTFELGDRPGRPCAATTAAIERWTLIARRSLSRGETAARRIVRRVDADRARELLRAERSRVEREIAALERAGSLEASDQVEPGDRDSENVYQDEFDEGRLANLRDELAAVERAEARLQAGTYGRSVVSGTPIPDARLEARPTAERTVEEEQAGG